MNCKNCKNWVFGRCTVSNLVIGPGQLCNAWELSQSHEFVETPFATFDEEGLRKRIAELEKFTDQLIEAGDWELRSLCAFLDYTEDACTYKYYDPYGAIRGWSALVKSWKEREE